MNTITDDELNPLIAAHCGSLPGVELPSLQRLCREVFALSEQKQAAALAELQARIDALMLEHCPDEMTPEQVAEWAKHQKPAEDAEPVKCRDYKAETELLRARIAELEAAQPAKAPEPCVACGGTRRMVRDPDIGTDQECFVCDGSGISIDEPAQVAAPTHWINFRGIDDTDEMMRVRAVLDAAGIKVSDGRLLAQIVQAAAPKLEGPKTEGVDWTLQTR